MAWGVAESQIDGFAKSSFAGASRASKVDPITSRVKSLGPAERPYGRLIDRLSSPYNPALLPQQRAQKLAASRKSQLRRRRRKTTAKKTATKKKPQ